jgi:uncharacterized protein YrrD
MRTGLLVAGTLLALTQFSIAQTPNSTVPVATPTARFISLGETAKLSSNVVGLDVYNDKDDLGKIKDVAFDESGVRAYILSVGGFLGMGTHYVAVTPSQIKVMYDASDKKWHANMKATKDELKAAPEFKYEGAWNAGQT